MPPQSCWMWLKISAMLHASPMPLLQENNHTFLFHTAMPTCIECLQSQWWLHCHWWHSWAFPSTCKAWSSLRTSAYMTYHSLPTEMFAIITVIKSSVIATQNRWLLWNGISSLIGSKYMVPSQCTGCKLYNVKATSTLVQSCPLHLCSSRASSRCLTTGSRQNIFLNVKFPGLSRMCFQHGKWKDDL